MPPVPLPALGRRRRRGGGDAGEGRKPLRRWRLAHVFGDRRRGSGAVHQVRRDSDGGCAKGDQRTVRGLLPCLPFWQVQTRRHHQRHDLAHR